MITLRPPQAEAIEATFKAWSEGITSGIIKLPPGVGKTIAALEIAKRVNGRTLWLAHTNELIEQPMRALRQVWPGVIPGVVKAERNEYGRDFVFASIQSAWRPGRLENLKNFDLVICDEARLSMSRIWQQVLKQTGCLDGETKLLGLDATPERNDGIALDLTYQKIFYDMQLTEAIAGGHLVPPHIVERPIDVDLDKIKTKGNDFDGGELDAALLEANIVDEVVDAFLEECKDLKTMIYTVSVKQAHLIADKLAGLGINSKAVSGETDKGIRAKALADYKKGTLQVLVNVYVFSMGFDEPTMEALIDAAPTQSKSNYLQKITRVLRTCDEIGKTVGKIICMTGSSARHTVVQAPVIFGTLATYDNEKSQAQAATLESKEKHRIDVLKRQLEGVKQMRKSALRWVDAGESRWAINLGDAGTVRLVPVRDLFRLEVFGRNGGQGIEELSRVVDRALALGIAEDYVRRANTKFGTKGAWWESEPATEKQISALRKWGITIPENCTKGQATDLMTAKKANNPWNAPATETQLKAIKRMTGKVPRSQSANRLSISASTCTVNDSSIASYSSLRYSSFS